MDFFSVKVKDPKLKIIMEVKSWSYRPSTINYNQMFI